MEGTIFLRLLVCGNWLWFVSWRSGAYVMILLQKLKITLCYWLLAAIGCNIVLEGASPLSIAADSLLSLFLLILEWFIVDASQIIILKLHMFKFGSENIHFAAIFKYHFVVQMLHTPFRLFNLGVFYKCFPHLCLLEDQNLNDGTIGTEQLIQIVMGNHITKLVVYANQ